MCWLWKHNQKVFAVCINYHNFQHRVHGYMLVIFIFSSSTTSAATLIHSVYPLSVVRRNKYDFNTPVFHRRQVITIAFSWCIAIMDTCQSLRTRSEYLYLYVNCDKHCKRRIIVMMRQIIRIESSCLIHIQLSASISLHINQYITRSYLQPGKLHDVNCFIVRPTWPLTEMRASRNAYCQRY